MKSKKKIASKKVYKLPASAREEPKEIQRSKYSEEPVKKGKTHYEADELSEEDETEI